ncbi:MAG TPA: preprotein translocase subunit SecA [Burkholderiales bacterium]|jgi:preprotein translocase subunit SecA|nr:preprotein translocase subunit SecA [Burkholderiales bacterium]
MVQGILKKIFGSRNDRLLKIYFKMVDQINALEEGLKKLSDDELKAKTAEFKERLAKGETLDDLLPEAFAVAREGSSRALGMRHFDVQLAAGIALHQGKISEMRTGEGKTLMATLPVYLNALSGRGVHVVTVNDYLARRDSEWMGRLYSFLGLTTGLNLPETTSEEKQAAYACDITYGTNNEFGFDYLRDNLEHEPGGRRQKPLNYAIVDEVDSILIDEARTPLIISGQADDHTDLYYKMNEVAPLLSRMESEPKTDQPDPPGDFWVDEKAHQVYLSEQGFTHAEEVLGHLGMIAEGDSLYAAQNIGLMHHLYAALRAHYLFHKDQHYVVQDGEVIIVDEFTGRLMTGRRWSDGLHQAVEAKENVSIQAENQTLASITFQNYFRMYAKLAGMTGTADTEAYEFQEIYTLETVIIPTHRDMIREDRLDQVYRTEREKYTAIINGIKDCYTRGQPVLVGTTSIENSELLAGMLEKEKLPHQVLNAKQHAKEAEIIAQAGRPKMITIATNMAGRGTDIVLGGGIEKSIGIIEAAENLTQTEKDLRVGKLKSEWQMLHDQVLSAGGLHIIGTERHESRRVDNQLRGRAGRQGDPGASRFYLSLEDPLLRIFAGERVKMIMDKLKMPDGEAIEAGIVTRSIESAQRKVEARNFDMRKQLLEYDDVANDQRKVVYQQRNQLLDVEDITDTVDSVRRDVLGTAVDIYVPPESVEEQWNIDALVSALKQEWSVDAPVHEWIKAEPDLGPDGIRERVLATADEIYGAKVEAAGRENWGNFERGVMLQSVDQHWRDHLAALDHLRQGIHLRGYAQKNPKQEYKREAFELFTQFLETVKSDVTKKLLTVRLQTPEEFAAVEEQARREAEALEARMRLQHALASAGEAAPEDDDDSPTMKPFKQFGKKVGRNELCPCGSGKKYKHCHGALA